ncbi:MAG: PorT family protein [Bacteroidales bacterium]|nr:PorT family protein [Bacteroidales bacterium]
MHRLLLMTAALCCILNAQAQLFKGGAELGLLASQVDGDNMTGYHKPGLYAALFTNLPLHEGDFQLQMGLAYLQKGCKATNSQAEGALNTYHLTLHQAGMPLTLRWNRLEPFFIEAGCSFNITPLIRIRRNGELYQLGADDDTYRFFELGGIAGLQWQLDGHWGLHLRMLYSLIPVGKSYYRSIGLRNNSLLLNLSYTF